MLRNANHLQGCELRATDGIIGSIKDFYFDDQSWAVRYIVVETGTWLAEQRVLITPHAVGRLDRTEHYLNVNLSKKQIEQSPSIDLHKPVSRQYEEEYYRYYGWPEYWEGGGVWGISDVPAWGLPSMPLASRLGVPGIRSGEDYDPHLRSTTAVDGYHIHAQDGQIGHVTDFLVDDHSWIIRDLVVKTGPWLFGKHVQVPTILVDRVDYSEATVFVNTTIEGIRHSPEYPMEEAVAEEILKAISTVNPNETPPRSKKTGRGPAQPSLPAANAVTHQENVSPTNVREIERLAYFYYLNEGQQPGNDVLHWLTAETVLRGDRNEREKKAYSYAS